MVPPCVRGAECHPCEHRSPGRLRACGAGFGVVGGGTTVTVVFQERPEPAGHVDPRRLWLRAVAGLEFGTEAAARADLARAVATSTTPWVIVELGRRRYVDVRGLAVLLETAELLDREGRRLAVVAPPASLRLMSPVLDPKGRVRLIDSAADADALLHVQDDVHVD
jgi:ABC-type transporter Mla MlaB component